MASEEPSTTPIAKVVSPAEALMQALKAAGAGRVLVYVKCPVTGAHHCVGRLTRVRRPFHAVPLTVLYKRSLGRGKGFGLIAESALVPTGIYLKVRELLKKYVGFASGVKGFGEHGSSCGCGSVTGPLLEKVRLTDGRVRFHLSFSCAGCGSVSRPWVTHYVDRFVWLVRRAKTVKALRVGGLRCRRCGERALRVRVRSGGDLDWALVSRDCRELLLRCGRCGFTINPPSFERSSAADEVVEVQEARR